MSKCERCGNEIPATANFCPYCGNPMQTATFNAQPVQFTTPWVQVIDLRQNRGAEPPAIVQNIMPYMASAAYAPQPVAPEAVSEEKKSAEEKEEKPAEEKKPASKKKAKKAKKPCRPDQELDDFDFQWNMKK